MAGIIKYIFKSFWAFSWTPLWAHLVEFLAWFLISYLPDDTVNVGSQIQIKYTFKRHAKGLILQLHYYK